jgi:hypothetical protein
MKHIWVVESSGGRKWGAAGGQIVPLAYCTKKQAVHIMRSELQSSPGLKWRVAKYERVK